MGWFSQGWSWAYLNGRNVHSAYQLYPVAAGALGMDEGKRIKQIKWFGAEVGRRCHFQTTLIITLSTPELK